MRAYRVRWISINVEPETRELLNKHFSGDPIETTVENFIRNVGLAKPNWPFCNDHELQFYHNLFRFYMGERNDDI